VFGLEDGLRLMAARGRLMQQTPAGAMAAVFAAEPACLPVVQAHADRLAIAAVNGPEETVLSGDPAALDQALARLEGQGVSFKRLAVAQGFHSPLMQAAVRAFRDELARVKLAPPRLRMVSDLTGTWADPAALQTQEYWVRHALEPVRFGQVLRTLAEDGPGFHLELGPHSTLTALGRKGGSGSFVPTLRRGTGESQAMLECARDCYQAGLDLDWRALLADRTNRKVALPLYRSSGNATGSNPRRS
jgi:acyl transferase domain-containing protein